MGGKFDELNAELIDRMEASSMEYYGRKLALCRPSPVLCLCCECLFMPLIRGVCSCAGCCEKLRTLRQRKWSRVPRATVGLSALSVRVVCVVRAESSATGACL